MQDFCTKAAASICEVLTCVLMSLLPGTRTAGRRQSGVLKVCRHRGGAGQDGLCAPEGEHAAAVTVTGAVIGPCHGGCQPDSLSVRCWQEEDVIGVMPSPSVRELLPLGDRILIEVGANLDHVQAVC
jgi:hypothetical protein